MGDEDQPTDNEAPKREAGLTSAARAIVLLASGGVAMGLGWGSTALRMRTEVFWTSNQIADDDRARLVQVMVVVAFTFVAAAIVWLVVRRKDPSAPERLWAGARRISPVFPLSLLPILLPWVLWKGHDFSFLGAVLATSVGFGRSVRASLEVGMTRVERWASSLAQGTTDRITSRWKSKNVGGNAVHLVPLVVVLAASAAYCTYFAYHSWAWHYAARSSYDLAIQDNILWNLLHGNEFFKASPTLGPTGSHYARHATPISFLLLPIYALHQSADTLLILQSLFVGAGAIPLFLLARRRLPPWVAVIVAFAYLLSPSVHGANLYEFHYLTLGPTVFWTAIYLLDARRLKTAVVFLLLTLLVREDVATWVPMLGMGLVLSGLAPRAGIGIAIVGSIYVLLTKFYVMPKFSELPADQLLFM